MNQRIRELILKAGWQNAYTDPKDGFELVFENEDHTLTCVKKFAELLIREAADFVSGAAEVYNQAEQDACVRASKGLKKHFGVE